MNLSPPSTLTGRRLLFAVPSPSAPAPQQYATLAVVTAQVCWYPTAIWRQETATAVTARTGESAGPGDGSVPRSHAPAVRIDTVTSNARVRQVLGGWIGMGLPRSREAVVTMATILPRRSQADFK